MAAPVLDRPIFLVASERSGSNLTRAIHGAHPNIAAPAPPHLLSTFLPVLADYGDLADDDNFRHLCEDVAEVVTNTLVDWQSCISAAELYEHARERSFFSLFELVYAREVEATGAERAFFKENRTCDYIWQLLDHFPDARFIWLVRDARDVAASFRKSPTHLGSVSMSATVWSAEQRRSLAAHNELRQRGCIVGLRYEDLLERPLEAVQGLCRFLDEPFAPEMLAFHERDINRTAAQTVTAWRHLAQPLMRNNSGKYRQELSAVQIWHVERIARRELELLGYALEYPNPLLVRFRSTAARASAGFWLLEQTLRGVWMNSGELGLRVGRVRKSMERGRKRRSRRVPILGDGVLF